MKTEDGARIGKGWGGVGKRDGERIDLRQSREKGNKGMEKGDKGNKREKRRRVGVKWTWGNERE